MFISTIQGKIPSKRGRPAPKTATLTLASLPYQKVPTVLLYLSPLAEDCERADERDCPKILPPQKAKQKAKPKSQPIVD